MVSVKAAWDTFAVGLFKGLSTVKKLSDFCLSQTVSRH